MQTDQMEMLTAARQPLMPPVCLDSRELFRRGDEVVIPKGEEYRLRVTRNEKLILIK